MSRRLQKELTLWKQGPVPMEGRCRVELVNESDLYVWRVFMNGPPSPSPYEGGIFVVDATFPKEYPFKPPRLQFQTKIYHPNIRLDTGQICVSEVGKNWAPTSTLTSLLQAIFDLLQHPSPDDPLETDIATLLQESPQKFKETARDYTTRYALTHK